MNDSTTARLTVEANLEGLPLGPLNVEIIGAGSELVEFVLTSQYRSHEIDIDPGDYTIIARRPNGARLRRSVTAKAGFAANVRFDIEEQSASPTSFLYPEAARGELKVDKIGSDRGLLKGFAADSLKAIQSAQIIRNFRALEQENVTLRVWPGQEWEPCTFQLGSSFIKVSLKRHQAVGLVDEGGFGPIIINPGFKSGIEITLSAEAVASKAAARSSNPSGLRTPVAVVLPNDEKISDLLTALSLPLVEGTEEVWKRSISPLDERSVLDALDKALDYMRWKFERPAEALAAAHYLLRFMPNKLPYVWAQNLARASQDTADGPVIAAWLLLLSDAPDVKALNPEACERDFNRLLDEALQRPKVLFARTRLLLAKGLSLRPQKEKEDAAKVLPFLDYGAQAGGLEAFWGRGPFSPGPEGAADSEPAIDVAQFELKGSEFGPAGILAPKAQ